MSHWLYSVGESKYVTSIKETKPKRLTSLEDDSFEGFVDAFDSSIWGMLHCLGCHCVTCEAESQTGSSPEVCLPTPGISSTCSHAMKTGEVFLQRTELPPFANLGRWTSWDSPHCIDYSAVCKHLASVTPPSFGDSLFPKHPSLTEAVAEEE